MNVATTPALVALLLVGCVPSVEPLDPRGGVTIRTDPSPASRSEPFVTADGWTLRVETLAAQVYFSASTVGTGEQYSGPGSSTLFLASQPVEVVIRAVRVGPARAVVTPTSRSIGPDGPFDRIRNRGVDAALANRFERFSDDTASTQARFGLGPSFVLAVVAEKAGRVVRLDVAFQSRARDEISVPVEVALDAANPVSVGVYAEGFFADDPSRSVLRFEPFSRADADGDGVLTPLELRREKQASCTGFLGGGPPGQDAGKDETEDLPEEDDPKLTCPSMLDTLALRGNQVFGAAPP